jgi:hypothetical protein
MWKQDWVTLLFVHSNAMTALSIVYITGDRDGKHRTTNILVDSYVGKSGHVLGKGTVNGWTKP